MQEIVCESIWTDLPKASKQSKHRFAAIAYLTTEKYVKFVAGDVVVVDASDEAIKTRKTSRALLKKLVRRGVLVHSLPKLHAKLIAFDDALFVGSMNFSLTSPSLTEIALKTKKRSVVQEGRATVQHLAALADKVDPIFIKRIMSLELLPREKRVPGKSKRTKQANRVWLVSTEDISEAIIAKEAKGDATGTAKARKFAVDKENVYSIRYPIQPGKRPHLRFAREARRGDRVLEVYTAPNEVTKVYRDSYVLSIHEAKNWRRVYHENSFDLMYKTWKGFLSLWKKAGGGHVSPKATRLLGDDFAKRLLADW
jgi:hypothetical protein